MTHPTPEDWMAYLYGESDSSERGALDAHLKSCAECRGQVAAWRGVMRDLERRWLPAERRFPTVGRRLVRATVAAGLLFVVGYAVGRLTRSEPVVIAAEAVDVAALRKAVAGDVVRALTPTLESSVRQEVARRVAVVVPDAVESELPGAMRRVRNDVRNGYRAEMKTLAARAEDSATARANEALIAFARDYGASRVEDRQALMAALRDLETDRQEDYDLLVRNLASLATLTGSELARTKQRLAQFVAYATSNPEGDK